MRESFNWRFISSQEADNTVTPFTGLVNVTYPRTEGDRRHWSDLDRDGQVIVRAFGVAGNEVPVTLNPGSDISVSGNTASARSGKNHERTDSQATLRVSVASPVTRLELTHRQAGSDNSGIHISDIFFDA